MNTYRYPGTRPFESEDQHIFFGRDNDIANLLRLVRNERMLLMYSKSGLGKTSLIKAGVVPRLDAKIQPVLVRLFAHHSTETFTPVQKITERISDKNSGVTFLDSIIKGENSLWYHLKSQQIRNTLNNNEKITLLVFDQFEELFSYPTEQIEEFKRSIADVFYKQIPDNFRQKIEEIQQFYPEYLSDDQWNLLYEPLNTKVLFSIRSDKLSLLNRLRDYLPTIQKTFYELKPLSHEQAQKAIVTPAALATPFTSPAFTYSDEAMQLILNYLTKNQTEDIETFLIQILCKNLEDKIRFDFAQRPRFDSAQRPRFDIEITPTWLGNIEAIIKNHYSEILEKLPDTDSRYQAQTLLEDMLIVNGSRVSLDSKIIATQGISETLLNTLVSTHIVRAKQNTLKGTSYEISHDTLVAPILEIRKIRIEKVEQERLERERLEELRIEKEKQERLEQERLEELRIERENAEKERIEREKERKRQQKIIAIVSLAALISLAFAIFGFVQKNNAQQQKQKAETALQEVKKANYDKFINEANSLIKNIKFDEALKSYDNAKSFADDTLKVNEMITVCKKLANEATEFTKIREQAFVLTPIMQTNFKFFFK